MYPTHFESESALVRKVVVGSFDNNSYWLACRRTGEAVLVDPSDEAGRLLDAAEGLEPTLVLVTHGHWDHVRAVRDLRDRAGLRVGSHEADAGEVDGGPDFTIADGEVLRVGDIELEARHTPGHTPGGLCFVTEGVVFSGDTLFPGGPGNTGGRSDDFRTIIESIETSLMTLDDDTLVMPGHGLDTTIGTERPHLAEWIERGW